MTLTTHQDPRSRAEFHIEIAAAAAHNISRIYLHNLPTAEAEWREYVNFNSNMRGLKIPNWDFQKTLSKVFLPFEYVYVMVKRQGCIISTRCT